MRAIPHKAALLCALAALLTLAVGCKSAPAPKNEAPVEKEAIQAPEEPGDPLAGLSIKLNDEVMTIAGAAVYDQGTSKRFLELSTVPISCDIYEPGGRNIREGEERIVIDFVSHLQPDGSMKAAVSALEAGDRLFEDVEGLTLGETNPDTGEIPFALNQELAIEANDFHGWPAASLSLQGEGRALMCGTWPTTSPMTARPQEGLTVTIAGKTFPIQGAVLEEKSGALILRLSAGPANCEAAARLSDLDITMELELTLGAKSLSFHMKGHALPSSYGVSLPPEELNIDAKTLRDNKAESVVFDIDKTLTTSDYNIEIKGKVDALNCQ